MTSITSVYVIGDSISIQYGPYLEELLRGKIRYSRKIGDEALYNLDQPMGANGGDSGMVLDYLIRGPQAGAGADALLLNCGLHDIKKDRTTGLVQVELPQYERNLRAIVSLARNRFRVVLWVNTTPVPDDTHNSRPTISFNRYNRDVLAYNEAAKRIMDEFKVPIIDLYGFTVALSLPSLYCDHVHYEEQARMLQAAYIAGALQMVRD